MCFFFHYACGWLAGRVGGSGGSEAKPSLAAHGELRVRSVRSNSCAGHQCGAYAGESRLVFHIACDLPKPSGTLQKPSMSKQRHWLVSH